MQAYVLLLRSYRQNSAHTNHCVAKMLHRLAHDLGMEALLFQLSLFCLFNRLLSDPAAGAYKVRGCRGVATWGMSDSREKEASTPHSEEVSRQVEGAAQRREERKREGRGKLGTGRETGPGLQIHLG